METKGVTHANVNEKQSHLYKTCGGWDCPSDYGDQYRTHLAGKASPTDLEIPDIGCCCTDIASNGYIFGRYGSGVDSAVPQTCVEARTQRKYHGNP